MPTTEMIDRLRTRLDELNLRIMSALTEGHGAVSRQLAAERLQVRRLLANIAGSSV